MLAVSETSAPSVISQSEMPPFSGENGNLSTSATLLGFAHFPYEGNHLLSLRDISPNRGISRSFATGEALKIGRTHGSAPMIKL